MFVNSKNFAVIAPFVFTDALLPPSIPPLRMMSLPASSMHASATPSIVIDPVARMLTPLSTFP